MTDVHHGDHEPRVTIMVGVVAEHDSAAAEELLLDLTARIMTLPDAPLLPKAMVDDCLITPPERGSRHVEIRWIEF